jgi:nicotinamide-nucleotide amidase
MSLAPLSRRVARLLRATGRKVVFAESCTGGLVSATLTKIPGISEHHCGGVVTYRNATKHAYLGIPLTTLDDPGPVSREVVELMARGVLKKTPEADLSVAVTGHLGPQAPPGMDGLVFVAVAVRKPECFGIEKLHCRRNDSRVVRQRWVVQKALALLADTLDGLIR